jgi:hypothetical protein
MSDPKGGKPSTGGSKPASGAKPEKRAITRARRNAELQMEYNEKMHRLAMLRRRIELAQSGVRSFEQKKITEAVKNFHSYIRILEDWKSVPEGGLKPALFDITKDVPELLLISGVYWDLTKLYDRTKSPDKQREFHHYLEKYVLFSRGMPFQHVCLETMRKYISNEKPVHKAEFKNAYKLLGGGSTCFVATSLIDVCDERTLPRLRRFRDERLSRSAGGRAFIAWYYRNGPGLAATADRAPEWVREGLGKALDLFAAVATASREDPKEPI